MSDDKASIVNSKMKELRQRYQSQLVERLSVINQLNEAIRLNNNKDYYLELRTVAHKLAGTGSTFNFPKISLSARALEVFIDAGDYDRLRLVAYIEALVSALKAAISEGTDLEGSNIGVTDKNITFPLNTKILIADDDNIVLLMLGKKFKSAGCEVITANNGYEALERLKSDIFSLIILDGMMPGYTGVELVKLARSDLKHSGTKIILISANNTEDDAANALNAGADFYLTKPFNPEDVLLKSFQVFSQ